MDTEYRNTEIQTTILTVGYILWIGSWENLTHCMAYQPREKWLTSLCSQPPSFIFFNQSLSLSLYSIYIFFKGYIVFELMGPRSQMVVSSDQGVISRFSFVALYKHQITPAQCKNPKQYTGTVLHIHTQCARKNVIIAITEWYLMYNPPLW